MGEKPTIKIIETSDKVRVETEVFSRKPAEGSQEAPRKKEDAAPPVGSKGFNFGESIYMPLGQSGVWPNKARGLLCNPGNEGTCSVPMYHYNKPVIWSLRKETDAKTIDRGFTLRNEALFDVNKDWWVVIYGENAKEQYNPVRSPLIYQKEGAIINFKVSENFSFGIDGGLNHFWLNRGGNWRTETAPFFGFQFTRSW